MDAFQIEFLRKEYRLWIEVLTTEEIRAIKKYSYNSFDKKPNRFYERLNAMLRGRKTYEQDMLAKYADTISEAIGKHTLQQPIICYRGSDIDITDGFHVDDTIVSSQFISTSLVETKAFSYKYKYTIYAPAGARGAYIEEISRFPKQREFLIDRNTRFRLLSRYKNRFELEVIP
ncbi:MAG: hypothetical protein IJJ65_08710 [Butyrivibrio sp.]|nr:hypothetical protein [Butyrivibrio sp.]